MPAERSNGDFESSDGEEIVEDATPVGGAAAGCGGAAAGCGGDRAPGITIAGGDPVLEMDAKAFKTLLSRAAKLLSIAETHSVRAVKSILADRGGVWAGTERRGAFLYCPASVLGLNGAPFRVRITMEAQPDEEDAEEEADEEAEYMPTAEEAAAAAKEEEAPAQKKR